MPILNYAENPLNFEKFKNHPNNSNLISFWAFLISMFIYISVFYTFNLSPSSLICTPKFWFILSNTLILIITADFTANNNNNYHDFYDEYRNDTNTRSTNFSPYVKIENTPKYRENEVCEESKAPDEKNVKIEDKPKYRENESKAPDEKIIAMVEIKQAEVPKADKLGEKVINVGKSNRVRKRVVDRCGSEKLNALAGNKEKNVLRKTLSERYDDLGETTSLEENEFSRMSDEELNRRVEDFIRRFNREIRLQAVNGS